MQKLIKLFPILFMGLHVANANVISRTFELRFQNEGEASSVRIRASATGESAKAQKLAAFSDLKGAVYTISGVATYDEATQKLTNEFSILKKDQSGETTVAKLSAPCVVENESSCRIAVHSEALSVEVESAIGQAPEAETVNVVDLVLDAGKSLSKPEDEVTGEEEVYKTLEDLKTQTSLKPSEDSLVYSDTQSGSSLSAKAEVDKNRNIGLTFKGKDGFIYLSTLSGARASFELAAPAPLPKFQFRRSIEMEVVAGNMMSAAVQIDSATVKAKLEQQVADEYRGLMFDTRLLFDESSLKPDPAQSDYVPGKGVLVLKEEQGLNNPVSLSTYFDIEPVEASDVLKNLVRTQSYRVKVGPSERVIKFRSTSGQRAQLVLADTPDPTKKDISALSMDFVLGAPSASGNADPFGPAQPQPAVNPDPFQQ